MLSTMGDFPLTITHLLRHGQTVHGRSEVATFDGEGVRRSSYAAVAGRIERLAAALHRLGIGEGDRVATFCYNHTEHLEAYFAVPCMGAVLHTVNIRLFPEHLAYVINHGGAKVLIVDDLLAPVLARVVSQLETVEHIVVTGSGKADALSTGLSYEDLLAAEAPDYQWPDLDERSAAALCYTSGTTGLPKGVAYSHRSTFLHSTAVTSGAALGISERDKVLVIVPMFHANAWGTPYAGWAVGADFLFAQRFVQAEPLARLIAAERPTLSAGVPSVWSDMLRYGETHDVDLSSLRMVTAGGSAVPRQMLSEFEERFGVKMYQGWGMTETSPVCAIAFPPKWAPREAELDWRAKTGRVLAGVELRIVAEDGTVQPNDGVSRGEIEVRGPWVTASYYREETPDKFHDGWLRTGDVATRDEHGFIQISDRAKDAIKSGGEWISSVDLENELMAHPGVLEASVIGVRDAKWDERPLAVIVARPGTPVDAESLRAFLVGRVAKWWIPEKFAFIDEIPKTSVGKFDKKALRARQEAGQLTVAE